LACIWGDYEDLIPTTNPILEGFEFIGWWTHATEGTLVVAGDTVENSSAHNLYARWREIGQDLDIPTINQVDGSGQIS